jgi:hypothetical protein
MHAFIKTAGIIVTTGILLGVALSPAQATTDTVDATVSAGNLTANGTTPKYMTGVTLDGVSAKASTGTPAPWTITNARGTNAGWALSVSATDFVSAAGKIDTTARTLPAENLTITPGVITASTGSDPAPLASPVVLPAADQPSATLVSTATLGKGTYTLTPTFSLNIPANTFRSNFSAAIGTSTVNPYVSTITFTIA